MHETGDVRAVCGLDGHDEPPVPLCDDGLLQRFFIGRAVNELIELLADPFARRAFFAPDGGKRGGGGIGHFIFRKDAFGDFGFQVPVGRDHAEPVVERGYDPFAVLPPGGHRAEHVQGGGNIQQLPHGENPACRGAVQGPLHIPEPAEGRRAEFGDQAEGVVRFEEEGVRLRKRLCGLELPRGPGGVFTGGFRGQQL